jgi:hypothetical protein
MKPRVTANQARQATERLQAAQTAMTAAVSERDRLIAAAVAEPHGLPLYDIAEMFGLSIPRVHTIAKHHGVTRNPTRGPITCSVAGCERPWHALGLCTLHYDRQYRQS